MLCVDRRDFLKFSGLTAGALAVCSERSIADAPKSIQQLHPMLDGIKPITDGERNMRIEKARRLMTENGLDAIYIEPGSSLFYFTGVQWFPGERMFALIIPAKGELSWVCPAFEEMRARELIRFGTDIRIWQEDENPYKRV